jgi:hypothetical protein
MRTLATNNPTTTFLRRALMTAEAIWRYLV